MLGFFPFRVQLQFGVHRFSPISIGLLGGYFSGSVGLHRKQHGTLVTTQLSAGILRFVNTDTVLSAPKVVTNNNRQVLNNGQTKAEAVVPKVEVKLETCGVQPAAKLQSVLKTPCTVQQVRISITSMPPSSVSSCICHYRVRFCVHRIMFCIHRISFRFHQAKFCAH